MQASNTWHDVCVERATPLHTWLIHEQAILAQQRCLRPHKSNTLRRGAGMPAAVLQGSCSAAETRRSYCGACTRLALQQRCGSCVLGRSPLPIRGAPAARKLAGATGCEQRTGRRCFAAGAAAAVAALVRLDVLKSAYIITDVWGRRASLKAFTEVVIIETANRGPLWPRGRGVKKWARRVRRVHGLRVFKTSTVTEVTNQDPSPVTDGKDVVAL